MDAQQIVVANTKLVAQLRPSLCALLSCVKVTSADKSPTLDGSFAPLAWSRAGPFFSGSGICVLQLLRALRFNCEVSSYDESTALINLRDAD